MSRRRVDFATAIIRVGTAIEREKLWLRHEIKLRLPKLSHSELCGVKDLVTALVNERKRLGPRNRRFMTRRRP